MCHLTRFTRRGAAEGRWVTVAVGSHLGSQLGYLGHLARRMGPPAEAPRGTAGGVSGRAGIAVAESRDGIRAAASFALSGGRIPPSTRHGIRCAACSVLAPGFGRAGQAVRAHQVIGRGDREVVAG